jgi:hypothetical protein
MPSLHTYFRKGKNRPAREAPKVFRKSNRLVLLVALVAAALLSIGGAVPAAAHGGHVHATSHHDARSSVGRQANDPSGSFARHDLQVRIAWAGLDAPHKGADKSGRLECCCGSNACHAGAALVVPLADSPFECGERLVPSPSSGVKQRVPSGLERPPRPLPSA